MVFETNLRLELIKNEIFGMILLESFGRPNHMLQAYIIEIIALSNSDGQINWRI